MGHIMFNLRKAVNRCTISHFQSFARGSSLLSQNLSEHADEFDVSKKFAFGD